MKIPPIYIISSLCERELFILKHNDIFGSVIFVVRHFYYMNFLCENFPIFS